MDEWSGPNGPNGPGNAALPLVPSGGPVQGTDGANQVQRPSVTEDDPRASNSICGAWCGSTAPHRPAAPPCPADRRGAGAPSGDRRPGSPVPLSPRDRRRPVGADGARAVRVAGWRRARPARRAARPAAGGRRVQAARPLRPRSAAGAQDDARRGARPLPARDVLHADRVARRPSRCSARRWASCRRSSCGPRCSPSG